MQGTLINCFSPSSALADTKGCPSRFRMPFSYVSPVTLDAPSLILPFGFKWMLSDFSPQTAAICTISEVHWNPVVSKSKYIKELLSGDDFIGIMVIFSKSAASSSMPILDLYVSPSKTDWEASFESLYALTSKRLLFMDCWLCCKRFRFTFLANLTVCVVVKSPGERANFLLRTALVLYWRPLSWNSHLAVWILCVRVHWLSLNTSQTGPLKQYGEQYRTKVNHMAGVWVCNLFLTLAPLITRLMLSI